MDVAGHKKNLSICIPTFNRRNSLSVLIESILKQNVNWERVEIIISDNNSTDGTEELLSNLPKWAPFILNRNKSNIGMMPNWAKAVELSNGEFVWLVGSDDILTDNSINKLLKVIESNKDISFILCNCINWEAETESLNLSEIQHLKKNPRSDITESYKVTENKILINTRSDAFTPIYCNIMPKMDWLEAISIYDNKKPFFSCIENTIPHAIYIARKYFHLPGYYIGEPLVISSVNVSWNEYLPLYLTQVLPELYTIWKKQGADNNVIKNYKKESYCPYQIQNVKLLIQGKIKGSEYFSLYKYIYHFYGIYSFQDLKEIFEIKLLGKKVNFLLEIRIRLSYLKKYFLSIKKW